MYKISYKDILFRTGKCMITTLNGVCVCLCASVCLCACACVHTHTVLSYFLTPWTVAHQASLSMEFSTQEH